MTQFNKTTSTLACFAFSLALFSQAHGAPIYRMTNGGNLMSYNSVSDFVNDTRDIDTAAPSGYEDDGWFYYGDAVYRTGGTGNLYSYPTVSDFLANSNRTTLATHSSYADDEWFTYDRGSGLKIYRVTNGANIFEYDSIGDVVNNNGANLNAGFDDRSTYGDDGYFSDGGSIYRVGNSQGENFRYDSWSDFESNTATSLGVPNSGTYANDGFMAIPEPATMSLLALGGLCVIARLRR